MYILKQCDAIAVEVNTENVRKAGQMQSMNDSESSCIIFRP